MSVSPIASKVSEGAAFRASIQSFSSKALFQTTLSADNRNDNARLLAQQPSNQNVNCASFAKTTERVPPQIVRNDRVLSMSAVAPAALFHSGYTSN